MSNSSIPKSKKSFSTLGFILVNIGCAVGLGNIWRFPKNMVEAGGSSYIIIYLIVLFIIALPLILLEMQYGLFYRRNAVSCFEKAGGKTGRFFGWQQMLGTGLLTIYYLCLVGYVLATLVASFVPSFFTQLGTPESNFFENEILNKEMPAPVVNQGTNIVNFNFNFSPWIFISCVVLILFSVFVVLTGIKGIEKVNMVLVPGLFVLMMFLLGYSLSLKNAFQGLKYLFQFDGVQFSKISVWFNVLKQAIFSTGIMFGTFIAFSKNANIKIDKANDALIVISADTLIGVTSGIIVVSIVSHGFGNEPEVLSGSKTIKNELDTFFQGDKSASGSLVFTVLPVIFLKMNANSFFLIGGSFGIGNFLFIFFVLALFFAAFSSLIALLEVFINATTENFRSMTRGNSLFCWSFFTILMIGFYSLSIGGDLIDEQDNAVLLTATVAGLFEVLFFSNHRNFRTVMKTNEKYSYLKLSPLNWFVKVCRYIVTPILLIMSVYGFLQFFSFDYYLTNLIPKDSFWNFLISGKPLVLTLPKIMSWVIITLMLFFAAFLTFNRSDIFQKSEQVNKTS